jgi:type II secretory pathway pseudopilin PulG
MKVGRKIRQESGFTIIEVALVLAIAALIFLVVFLAVPALQRNQRDDGRKRDISIVIEALTNYCSNTNSFPATQNAYVNTPQASTTFGKYLTKLSNSTLLVVMKTGTYAVPADVTSPITATKFEQIVIYTGYVCGAAPADAPTKTGASARNAVAITTLESSGGGTYCMGVQ